VYRDGKSGLKVPLALEAYQTAVVVVPHTGHTVPHLTDSPLPVLGVQRHGTTLRATVEATAPGEHRLTGTDGHRTYRGTVRVDDALDPVTVEGDWTFTFEKDAATPVTAPLGTWTDHDRLFSGSGTYAKDIDLTAAQLTGRRVLLDLGDVREVALVTVNGEELPALLWAPFTADITDQVKAGRNTVTVRVANTLSNERNKPIPSGLLGPVAVRFARRVTAELRRD
jgi:hypothetical protein